MLSVHSFQRSIVLRFEFHRELCLVLCHCGAGVPRELDAKARDVILHRIPNDPHAERRVASESRNIAAQLLHSGMNRAMPVPVRVQSGVRLVVALADAAHLGVMRLDLGAMRLELTRELGVRVLTLCASPLEGASMLLSNGECRRCLRTQCGARCGGLGATRRVESIKTSERVRVHTLVRCGFSLGHRARLANSILLAFHHCGEALHGRAAVRDVLHEVRTLPRQRSMRMNVPRDSFLKLSHFRLERGFFSLHFLLQLFHLLLCLVRTALSLPDVAVHHTTVVRVAVAVAVTITTPIAVPTASWRRRFNAARPQRRARAPSMRRRSTSRPHPCPLFATLLAREPN